MTVKMNELYNGWCKAIGADTWVGEYDNELGNFTCEQFLKEVKKYAYKRCGKPVLEHPQMLMWIEKYEEKKFPCITAVAYMDTVCRHPFKVLACPDFYMHLIEIECNEYKEHGHLWEGAFSAIETLK